MNDNALASHEVMPVRYIVVTGQIADGFKFYGPFSTYDKAHNWADINIKVGSSYGVYPINYVRDDGFESE